MKLFKLKIYHAYGMFMTTLALVNFKITNIKEFNKCSLYFSIIIIIIIDNIFFLYMNIMLIYLKLKMFYYFLNHTMT